MTFEVSPLDVSLTNDIVADASDHTVNVVTLTDSEPSTLTLLPLDPNQDGPAYTPQSEPSNPSAPLPSPTTGQNGASYIDTVQPPAPSQPLPVPAGPNGSYISDLEIMQENSSQNFEGFLAVNTNLLLTESFDVAPLTSETPTEGSDSDRTLTFRVTDSAGLVSNDAVSTITVIGVESSAPDTDGDGVTDDIDVDDDNDGILDVVENRNPPLILSLIHI